MKVFNWVLWKFHHGHSDARKENGVVEKNGMMKSSKKVDVNHDEKHVLLNNHWDHDDDDDDNDHLQDGLILAIGTLGVHALFVDHNQENNHDLDDDDDDDNLLSNIGCKEIEEVINDESNEDQYKRRVTLADLFSENSDSDHDDHDHDHDHDYYTVKEVVENENPICLKTKKSISRPKKNGFTKAKKLLKDDFRPLNVFNQLMKRMVKKKIHPDMEGKMKKDIQMQPSASRRDHQVISPHESASSLLLIPDAVV